ncbi:MAG: hypothetical protein HKN50_05390 [Gammaproteobacteria bacterium]|nr:hypothetical protein [Gammaproteobacteria bacterium]
MTTQETNTGACPAIDMAIVELIQRAADQELSRAENRKLRRALAESAEARALHAELTGVVSWLESAPQEELPEGLNQRLMAQAIAMLPPQQTASSGWDWRSWLVWPTNGLQRGAYAFTLVAVITMTMLQFGADNIDELTGDLVLSRVESGVQLAIDMPADEQSELRIQLPADLAYKGNGDGVTVNGQNVVIDGAERIEHTLNLTETDTETETHDYKPIIVEMWTLGKFHGSQELERPESKRK